MQSFFTGSVLVMLIFASSIAGNINDPVDQPAIQAGIAQDDQGGRFGTGTRGLRADMMRLHKTEPVDD